MNDIAQPLSLTYSRATHIFSFRPLQVMRASKGSGRTARGTTETWANPLPPSRRHPTIDALQASNSVAVGGGGREGRSSGRAWGAEDNFKQQQK